MTDQLALYVDDDDEYRHPPTIPGFKWLRAYNFHQAIVMLETHDFALVSLDHDIASWYGSKEMKGRDILNYLIERKEVAGLFKTLIVRVHTANPVGRATMLADAKRYFCTLQLPGEQN